MKRIPLPLVAVAIVLFLIVVFQTFFVVPETHTAIVLRFGEPVAQYSEAGLRVKTPFIERKYLIDKRNLELDQPPMEIIASDQERLLVDAFARYRIIDPLLFYQTLVSVEAGEERLRRLMESDLRAVLSEVGVDDIISTRRAELMVRIKMNFGDRARRLGVEVIDVKIRRADLPQQNSEAVFARMISERNQRAQQIRSEGNEQAQRIRAQADREAVEIKAKAEEEAQRTKGAADAERSAVFASAYGQDKEFFAFYRSLLAYEEALRKGDTTIILSPDSEFLRYLNSLQGRRN